jgi:hypothetical protein
MAGMRAKCNGCGAVVVIPKLSDAPEHIRSTVSSTGKTSLCPICKGAVNSQEAVTSCPSCHTIYHTACWQEIGGCGLYGCPQVPVTEHRTDLEIPASYWGQENKQCPVCEAVILASAIRCRNCGATFQSRKPQGKSEYLSEVDVKKQLPKTRRAIILLFIFCIVPFTAPIAALIGALWYLSKREHLKYMPRLYSIMLKLALFTAIGQTIFYVIIIVIMNSRL